MGEEVFAAKSQKNAKWMYREQDKSNKGQVSRNREKGRREKSKARAG